MQDDGAVKEIVGRPRKARAANPEVSDLMQTFVTFLARYGFGVAMGVVEGLADAGKLPLWGNLHRAWKATICGATAAAAAALEEMWKKAPPRSMEAGLVGPMHDLHVASANFAIMHGLAAGVTALVPLLGFGGLDGLATDEAAEARAAIRELLDNRGMIEQAAAGADPAQAVGCPQPSNQDNNDVGELVRPLGELVFPRVGS